MKVILLQDVKKLGKKYDVKNVSDGYARNLLIPKSLVKPYTENNMKIVQKQKILEALSAEESLKKTQEFASSIDGLEVIIPVKVGEKGELFESINSQKIAEKLNEMGYQIKKGQIEIQEPFKELGEFPAKIRFEHNLEAEIRIIVVEENLDEKIENRK